MSKSTLKILPALMAAITAALVTQPVFGSSIDLDHQMVFTENSSSSLSVTYDGSSAGITVTPISPDGWTVTFSQSFTSGGFTWQDPTDAAVLSNLVLFLSGGRFDVISDFLVPTTQPNGSTYVGAGTQVSDGTPFDMTFNDNGDTARTPDTGTTGSLLGLSLVGLGFLRRKLC